ncbi:unnamed protein product, partial [Ectocarpus sp. 13 AM-2016]
PIVSWEYEQSGSGYTRGVRLPSNLPVCTHRTPAARFGLLRLSPSLYRIVRWLFISGHLSFTVKIDGTGDENTWHTCLLSTCTLVTSIQQRWHVNLCPVSPPPHQAHRHLPCCAYNKAIFLLL